MSTFHCPHCSVILSAAELKEGWCEKCGKHVPEHLLSAAAKEDRLQRHEHLTHKQAPLPHVQATTPLLAADKDLDPARPLPSGLIGRGIAIVLAVIALGTMVFPWGRGDLGPLHNSESARAGVKVEQTGLQMLYGGTSLKQGDNTSTNDLLRTKNVLPAAYYSPPLIVGFPVCLLLAIGSLLLLDHKTCWQWAATWSTLAVVTLLAQWVVGFPTDRYRTEPYHSVAMWVGISSAFLLVMLSVWPMTSAPEAKSTAWAIAAPLLVLVAAVYAGAFFLPAVYSKQAGEAGEVISGSMAYDIATNFRMPCWYANPVGWMAALLVICRRWLWAAGASLVALWLGLNHFIDDRMGSSEYIYAWGYWQWLASFALILIGSLVGWVVTKFVFTRPSPLATADTGD